MQRKYRLKKGYQFNYIYRRGKSVAGKEMVLYFVKNRTGKMQIGISVSKKIGKSTVRNRVKRVFKECARKLIPQIDCKYNFVLLARAQSVGATYNEVLETLKSLLLKSGCLIENEISDSTAN